MSYLDTLKKKSKDNYEALKGAVEKPDGGRQSDDRFWKLSVDATGKGSAIIRFLPPMEGENVPFVKKFSHFFQGPNGKYYAENCPSTLGRACPVCEKNFEIYKSNAKEIAQKLVGKANRSQQYFSNIYVIKDPANPENEGKVFLYAYGQKIFDMIKAVIKPEFEDSTSYDPFNLWEGANFKLRAKTENDFRTYSQSEFDSPSVFLDGDESKIIAVLNSIYSLQSLIDNDQFKEYDDLVAQLNRVNDMGSKVKSKTIEDRTQHDTPSGADLNDLPFDSDSSKSDEIDIDDLLKDL